MHDTTTPVTPPRHIPVNGRRIHLRWLQQLIWLAVAANLGAWIISAVYYLVIETRWRFGGHTYLDLKPSWDNLFSFHGWRQDRHDLRNVYEALLATLFVRSLLANWRKNDRRAPAWYVAVSPAVIVAAAFPVVVAGIALINYALPDLWHLAAGHHVLRNPVRLPHGLSWLGTYLSGFPWQPTVIGVAAGLVVHRVYAPAGNTVQLHFVGRAVDRARDAAAAGQADPRRHLPQWPWPPVVRERAWWIMTNDIPVPGRTRSTTGVVRFTLAVLLALAGYGAYVRFVIAKGHAALRRAAALRRVRGCPGQAAAGAAAWRMPALRVQPVTLS